MAKFQKGMPRPEGAGRKKGTPNKANVDLLERMQAIAREKYGLEEDWHPVLAMSELAMDMSVPRELRQRALAESAQYVAPKRRAMEHTGPGGGPLEVKIDLVDKIVAALAGGRKK